MRLIEKVFELLWDDRVAWVNIALEVSQEEVPEVMRKCGELMVEARVLKDISGREEKLLVWISK